MVDVQRAQGNPRAQPGIETSIHLAPRFYWSQWMTFAATDDHLLRIAAGQRPPEPGLRQLPEQRAFAAILARGSGGDQQAVAQGIDRDFIQLPGQALTGRIAGKQPITGCAQCIAIGVVATLLYLHL
ncbi:hypothetical protein D3C84_1015900 [compost metagenome]